MYRALQDICTCKYFITRPYFCLLSAKLSSNLHLFLYLPMYQFLFLLLLHSVRSGPKLHQQFFSIYFFSKRFPPIVNPSLLNTCPNIFPSSISWSFSCPYTYRLTHESFLGFYATIHLIDVSSRITPLTFMRMTGLCSNID